MALPSPVMHCKDGFLPFPGSVGWPYNGGHKGSKISFYQALHRYKVEMETPLAS